MKFKKSQSGRSMVEMLGVLAIIGVLSVGGIAGYSLSMRRHRANQIVNLMSKYALVAYSKCQQQNIGSCDDWHLSFEDTGIGTLPAGVHHDSHATVSLNSYSEDSGWVSDEVKVSLNFDDDKLCQAVGSIAGTGCGENTSGKYVVFKLFYD